MQYDFLFAVMSKAGQRAGVRGVREEAEAQDAGQANGIPSLLQTVAEVVDDNADEGGSPNSRGRQSSAKGRGKAQERCQRMAQPEAGRGAGPSLIPWRGWTAL